MTDEEANRLIEVNTMPDPYRLEIIDKDTLILAKQLGISMERNEEIGQMIDTYRDKNRDPITVVGLMNYLAPKLTSFNEIFWASNIVMIVIQKYANSI